MYATWSKSLLESSVAGLTADELAFWNPGYSWRSLLGGVEGSEVLAVPLPELGFGRLGCTPIDS